MKNIILFILLILYIIYTIRKTARKKKLIDNTASTEKNETVTYEEQDPEEAQFWERIQGKEPTEVVALSKIQSEKEQYPYEKEVYEEEADDSDSYKSEEEYIDTIPQLQKTEPKPVMRIRKETSRPEKCMRDKEKSGISSMFKHKHLRRRELRKAVVWSEILAKPVSLRDE